MAMYLHSVSLLLLLVCSVLSTKLLQVTRKLDLRSHVLRVQTEITVDNLEKEYQFVVDPLQNGQLAFMSASLNSDGATENLHIKDLGKSVHGHQTFAIQFNHGLPKPVRFTVDMAFTHALEPKPHEILQSEKQFIIYTGNLYFFTPYQTVSQETHVLLPKGEVLSYTDTEKPLSKSADKIVYGPFGEQDPFTKRSLKIHYENGSPFLSVTSMTRLIEVSHWGNIAVEETYDVVHYGAKLRGPFSRLDFQVGIGHHSAVRFLKTFLPASARDIYYRDEIGNISTSAVRERFDSVEVELTPRFPLMGGWKTQYTLGYNVPAYEYLYRKGDNFVLRMHMVDHIYDEQIVENFLLKVVIPETSTDLQFAAPYPISSQSMNILKTYLDTVGRPVLEVTANNLIEDHIKDFTLSYRFNMFNMLREPLMLIVAFFLLFMCIIIYVRVDLSIFRDEKSDIRLRTQAIVEEIQGLQNRRSALYESYENTTSSFKSSKHADRFHNERRKIETEHKSLTQHLGVLQTKLAEFYTEGSEKVGELQTLDQRYRELAQESMQLAERLVSGKVNKAQYQVSDSELCTKKAELLQRMESIVEGL